MIIALAIIGNHSIAIVVSNIFAGIWLHCVGFIIIMLNPDIALLTQWVEELEKQMISRQNDMAARIHNQHQDMTHSQQTAMQIAQAAAVHAANQKSARPYHSRYVYLDKLDI